MCLYQDCLYPSLKLKLMYLAHDIPTSGHRGASATFRSLRKAYWWAGMRREIYHYCSGCLKCHQAKATERYKLGLLTPYSSVPPGHTLHIDYFGPFPVSRSGNTIVLTAVDRASGHLWAYPCKDSRVPTLALQLYQEHFMKFGLVIDLISDNGPSFRAAMIVELDKLMGIRHLFTTPYNPQSNGMVERPHRTLKAALKCFVNSGQSNWDEMLAPIVFAICTTPREGSIYSPFALMFHRDPITPIELLSGMYSEKEFPTSEVLSLEFQFRAAKAMREVRRVKEERSRKMIETAEPAPVWEVGQLVLIHREVIKKDLAQKFLYQWVGPFRIVQRMSPVVYRVDLGNGRGQSYHIRRLHPFFPTTHPRLSQVQHIDLFDVESPLECGDEVSRVELPVVSIKEGQMSLALIDEVLRVGRVRSVDFLTQKLTMHVFDTLSLGHMSQEPGRWTEKHYPVYLTADSGMVVKKDKDLVGEIPVEVIVSSCDLLDVPFELGSSHVLNLAQRTVVRQWYGLEQFEEIPRENR